MEGWSRSRQVPAAGVAGRGARRTAPWLLAAALGLGAAPAFADVILSSVGEGWVNSRGGSNEAAPVNNTFTGNELGMRYNSWVAFYVPAGSYTSATLSITPSYYGEPGPSVIGLFDVTTPYSGFANTFHPGTDVFKDLGSGRQYAAATLYDQPLDIALNGRALADVNGATDHFFLIGFTNQTLNALPSTASSDGIYINGTGRSLMELTLGTATTAKAADVPEPASWMSMGGGLALLAGVLRRRRRT
ncbi:PEP-CTERM sorting domain-containing protein [Massilia sp. TN1-12]|uniref:PEP-CTERM sorting domain-containing protein n=1 Tax=Massilia paldalensis TaxID=3377675 RepID=UPI0038509446